MINSSTVIITILLVILTLGVSRKYFLLSFIITACFVPADQRILFWDLDFTPLRILLVVGLLRTMFNGVNPAFRFNSFDKLFFTWAVCGSIIYILRWSISTPAIVFQCGILMDIIGMYLLFRFHLRCWDDIERVVKFLAACSLVTAIFVGFEYITGRNPFIVLGRVTTWVRDGHYRCQASFPHSILLGLFWATLLPLFVGMARKGKQQKSLFWLATIASVWVVLATASSTPVLTLLAVLCLLPMFNYRCFGRQAAWAVLGLLFALHIVMKAPVWHLISRIDVVSGSTGWHRYHLIDQAIDHFSEWALLGSRGTGHWGHMMQDITNQYILEGVRGGIITLILFIVLLVKAVATVGSYSLRKIPIAEQWFAWCLCVSILGHCISFFGVSYFGQIRMLLYLMFALVAFVYEMNISNAQLVQSKVCNSYE